MDDEKQLHELIDRMNQVWLTGDSRPMRSFLHEDAVLLVVDVGHQAQGREQYELMAQSFLREMRNRTFRFGPKRLNVWGGTAVARQSFEMSFMLERDRYTDVCSVTTAFSRIDGAWLVTWTQVSVRTKPDL